MARGPRKKTLDLGGNPDHVMLGLAFSLGLGLRLSFNVTHIRTILRLGCCQVIPATVCIRSTRRSLDIN